jgi:hypothetical protein
MGIERNDVSPEKFLWADAHRRQRRHHEYDRTFATRKLPFDEWTPVFGSERLTAGRSTT